MFTIGESNQLIDITIAKNQKEFAAKTIGKLYADPLSSVRRMKLDEHEANEKRQIIGCKIT